MLIQIGSEESEIVFFCFYKEQKEVIKTFAQYAHSALYLIKTSCNFLTVRKKLDIIFTHSDKKIFFVGTFFLSTSFLIN